MKKFLFSLLFLIALFTSCQTGERIGIVVENNRLIIEQESITIEIHVNENDYMVVTASAAEYESGETRFHLNTDDPAMPFEIFKDSKGRQYFGSGSYRIFSTAEGISFYRDEDYLFTSRFMMKGKRIVEEKNTGEGEYLYGMGHSSKTLLKDNEEYSMYHFPRYGDQTYMFIPQVYSSGGDSFTYNSHVYDSFNFGAKGSGQFQTASGSKKLQFFYRYGEKPSDVVEDFYRYTESESLLPRWAYGFIQSKYGYRNQQEVIDLVDEFENRGIPLSAVVLDLYWFDHMGDLNWDKENWPDPARLDSYLEERGIKMMTITEPYVTSDSSNFELMAANGLLGTNSAGDPLKWQDWWCFDSADGAIMNPFAPQADEIWGSQYVRMREQGIDGFWTDLGEPENVPRNVTMEGLKEHEFHNYYNRAWSEMIYRSMKESNPDERLFILSRSGYTGSAGYGVSHWSGDVPATFQGLSQQIPLGLNAALSGFSFWGSDVGGFTGAPDAELLVRWYQFGLFSPVFRAHGTSEREPWSRGNQSEELIREIINWRYRLLPYIYSSAWQTARFGMPMMRPLFMEYPEDKEAWLIEDQYFFGDSLMVAPVTKSASRGKTRKYYLPEGNWLNLFEMTERKSGWHEEEFAVNQMPVYIREGAVIPMDFDGVESLLLYPGPVESSATIFKDDGWSENYSKGGGERLTVVMRGGQVEISGVMEDRNLLLLIPREGQLLKQTVQLQKDIINTFNISGL